MENTQTLQLLRPKSLDSAANWEHPHLWRGPGSYWTHRVRALTGSRSVLHDIGVETHAGDLNGQNVWSAFFCACNICLTTARKRSEKVGSSWAAATERHCIQRTSIHFLARLYLDWGRPCIAYRREDRKPAGKDTVDYIAES
jgi:hypothetical protein